MRKQRDEGAVLILVLVLIVVAAFIVVPLLDYSVAVFRSNNVVSNRTKQTEAAKGGLRMALGDPKNVFVTCDGGTDDLTPQPPLPNPEINGISVQTNCTLLEEFGPNEALGFEVPRGAVAMQLGATVPASFSGTFTQSPAVPPYPVAPDGPDWWATPAQPDPGAQYSSSAEADKIWMPDLPRRPSTDRLSTPFDMPNGYSCGVFFPGRYTAPLDIVPMLDGDGDLIDRFYFASGVYYFEQPVTISGDVDVIVGYGLDDFTPASDCADDIQVAANVINPPATFDINGGGATWVFGANGQLVIDNATMGSGATVRFNQRYADADRGGRISIMTVNGDDVNPVDHEVTNVNRIPRSLVLNGATPTPMDPTGYQPSSSTYTDKARLPEPPAALTVTDLQEAGTAPDRGVALVTWDEVAGQDAGGALLGEQLPDGTWPTPPYQVQMRVEPSGAWTDVCPPDEQVITPKANPIDGNEVTCSVGGLDIDITYGVQVRAENEVGTSGWIGQSVTPTAGSGTVTAPDAPSSVIAVDSDVDDVAQISWDAPDNGGAPITRYDVTAYHSFLDPHPDADPVAPNAEFELTAAVPFVGTVPAFDPNGETPTINILDASALPVGSIIVATGRDVAITATVPGTYDVTYEAVVGSTTSAPGTITVNVGLAAPSNVAPVADTLELHADVGVPIVSRIAAFDPNGVTDTLVLTVSDPAVQPGFVAADWTVLTSGFDVSVTTTAPDGTYSLPYSVKDLADVVANGTIEVLVQRGSTAVGTCEVVASPALPMINTCEIGGLADLTPPNDLGYRFEVTATNAVGVSDIGINADPLPTEFDGTGSPLAPPAVRMVEPWIPVPIIDIRVGGAAPVELSVAGYVAVPMGRVSVVNNGASASDITINGGVMSGTYFLDDWRATGSPGSVPIGFKNDIVLQRKVRIVSIARNVTSTAIVQVNEDGAGYAVNAWVID